MSKPIFEYADSMKIKIVAVTPEDADEQFLTFFREVNAIAYRMGISFSHGESIQRGELIISSV